MPKVSAPSGAPLAGSPPGDPHLTDFRALFSLSPSMRALGQVIEDVARTDAPVLIRGESGVGKNLVARAIHAASAARNGPFVLVNCAALPNELLESELFGHERGAFTGAHRRKLGKFEYANGGTICLDEIGEIPLGLQAKLLHVLQDLQFTRVGGHEPIRVDVRVLATTNRDLEEAIEAHQFRRDLYWRLNVVEVCVPPLRERREAIAGLTAFFLARYGEQYARQIEIPPETTALMAEYAWPGNVRELENFVRRMVALRDPRRAHEELVARQHRGPLTTPRAQGEGSAAAALPRDGAGVPLDALRLPSGAALMDLKLIARQAAQSAERRALLEVLERVRWNRTEAARLLNVSYKTLRSKLAEFGLTPGRKRRAGVAVREENP
jgi:transcriptional regulator with GAF, ATPase, and Fis domain